MFFRLIISLRTQHVYGFVSIPSALRLHDGIQAVEPVFSPASARLAKTLVLYVVPDRASDLAAAVEEHATVGAGRVQVAVAAMLIVAVRTAVAVDDPGRTSRATY